MALSNNRRAGKPSGGLIRNVGKISDQSIANHEENTGLRLEDFVIVADEFEYPLEENIPGGYYVSEIKKIEPRVKNEKILLDVSYELISKTGDVYYIKQTYPKDSKPLLDLYRALVAAGVKPGPNLRDAIGVREVVALAYVSKTSEFGSIIKRIPKAEPVVENDEFDDEDDEDYLYDD